MKTRIITFLFFTSVNFIFSQNGIINFKNLNPYLQTITDSIPQKNFQAFVDEKNDLNFVLVVDSINLDKEQIYNRVLSYFAYNYKDSKSVIQIQDKEAGLIIGKGIFELGSYIDKLGSGITSYAFVNNYSCYHILRVDIKENKVRIIISATNYDIKIPSVVSSLSEQSIRIADVEPLKYQEPQLTNRLSKKLQLKAFENAKKNQNNAFRLLTIKSIESQLSIEKLLKENTKSKETENW